LAQVVDAQPGRRYLVANSGGYGFIVKSEELLSRVRAGKTFMTVEEGDEVLRPVSVPDKPVMAVTLSEHGRMLLFDAAELKELARGRGITLVGLDDNEKMKAVGFSDGKSVSVAGVEEQAPADGENHPRVLPEELAGESDRAVIGRVSLEQGVSAYRHRVNMMPGQPASACPVRVISSSPVGVRLCGQTRAASSATSARSRETTSHEARASNS